MYTIALVKTGCCATIAHLILIVFLPSADAQPDDQRQRSELGVRQQLVERKMVELENSFTAIAEKLKDQEPERHKLLIQAYQSARETLITRKMAEVTQLLDAGRLDEASAALNDVIDRLDDLVRLLLDNQSRPLDKQEQIAQFEQWKQAIESLRQEQTSQRKETGKVANKDSELEKLDGQIKKLDQLIDRQQDLIEQTKQTQGAGLREMDRVADGQFELRRETEDLARDVSGDSGNPGSGLPTRINPGESSAIEEETSKENQNDRDSQSQAGESGESQSGESQSGESQSGQPQSGQPQSGQPQSESQQSSQPQPGQQALQQSAKSQERAEEDLGSGRPQDAEREQQKALEELAQARTELKKEQRRLASLPPDVVENMARQQRRTKDKALELIEKMAKAPDADGNSDEQVSQPNSAPQPGQQPMQQAAESMEGASGDLQDQEPDKAERKQREAEKQLEEALEEIEERLNQLRDETREEKLRRLEARFTEMLERQRAVSATTIEIEDRKSNLGKLQTRDRLVMLRQATEEAAIGELGQQAYDLLLEDGTSDVYPELVQDLRTDLMSASQLLQEGRSDQLTQLLQQEIESALLDLLEALEESKEEGGGSGGGGAGGGGDQPLLKRSAELKMLKAAQQRLNRKTRQLDMIKGSNSEVQDNPLDQEIGGLSGQQSKLQEMAEQIMEKDN